MLPFLRPVKVQPLWFLSASWCVYVSYNGININIIVIDINTVSMEEKFGNVTFYYPIKIIFSRKVFKPMNDNKCDTMEISREKD